jgi:hypothetical protein
VHGQRAPGDHRGGAGHGGKTEDLPLGPHDSEGRGDGVRRRSSASGGLRWPATSTGSSCSTRPMRVEGEAHEWVTEKGWGSAHQGGGVSGGTRPRFHGGEVPMAATSGQGVVGARRALHEGPIG